MTRLRPYWIALGWLWVGVIVYLSLTPHPPEPLTFDNADKIEHLLAYGCLMMWFAQSSRSTAQLVLTMAALAAMGVGIEFIQGMTGYRAFEYADMLANATGVLLAGLLSRTALGRIGAILESRLFGNGI